MQNPAIQIIIPVYNAEQTLKRCLDSVIAQTFEDWQAILIDDASTDRSASIMRMYSEKDARFICMYHTNNLGVAKTRNEALALLSSKYVAFLDSDDWWEPEMLQVMLESAEREQADIIQCRYMYDYPGGKSYIPKGAFGRSLKLVNGRFKPIWRRMLVGINMNHVCMKLIRTDVISGVLFDAELKTAEDLAFSIRMFRKAVTYVFEDRVLYHYYRNPASLTGSGLSTSDKLESHRIISKMMKQELPAWGMNNPFYYLLASLRPFVIALSKLFRTAREKRFTKN